MKRFGLILLALLTIFSLAGCGSSTKETKTETKTETTAQDTTKTETKVSTTPTNDIRTMEPFVKGEYLIKEKVISSSMGDILNDMVMTVAVKNGKMYVLNESGLGSYINIVKDGTVYYLDVASKTYMTTEATDLSTSEANTSSGTAIDPEALKDFTETRGREAVEGKEYEYQEFSKDNVSLRYYFDNNKLKYVQISSVDSEDNKSVILIEIIEFSSTVADSLFDIPSDYTKVESLMVDEGEGTTE